MEKRTTVKVNFQGETKRFKTSTSIEDLVSMTKKGFKKVPEEIKFYYLDEDNEIICVSTDSDLEEVLTADSIGIIKFIVA